MCQTFSGWAAGRPWPLSAVMNSTRSISFGLSAPFWSAEASVWRYLCLQWESYRTSFFWRRILKKVNTARSLYSSHTVPRCLTPGWCLNNSPVDLTDSKAQPAISHSLCSDNAGYQKPAANLNIDRTRSSQLKTRLTGPTYILQPFGLLPATDQSFVKSPVRWNYSGVSRPARWRRGSWAAQAPRPPHVPAASYPERRGGGGGHSAGDACC